jgi:hypothetical protein
MFGGVYGRIRQVLSDRRGGRLFFNTSNGAGQDQIITMPLN